jgi:hypothetical protein
MQTIGDQRHRTESQAAADFGDHHHEAERNDHPAAALIAGMIAPEKIMIVPESFERMAVHGFGSASAIASLDMPLSADNRKQRADVGILRSALLLSLVCAKGRRL